MFIYEADEATRAWIWEHAAKHERIAAAVREHEESPEECARRAREKVRRDTESIGSLLRLTGPQQLLTRQHGVILGDVLDGLVCWDTEFALDSRHAFYRGRHLGHLTHYLGIEDVAALVSLADVRERLLGYVAEQLAAIEVEHAALGENPGTLDYGPSPTAALQDAWNDDDDDDDGWEEERYRVRRERERRRPYVDWARTQLRQIRDELSEVQYL
jgi:hypothetical protein